MYVCMYVCMDMHMYVTCLHVHTGVHVCMYVNMHVLTCVHTCKYVSICVYIHVLRSRLLFIFRKFGILRNAYLPI